MNNKVAARRVMSDARQAALSFFRLVEGDRFPKEYAKAVLLLIGIYGIHENDALQIAVAIPHGALPEFNKKLHKMSADNRVSDNPVRE